MAYRSGYRRRLRTLVPALAVLVAVALVATGCHANATTSAVRSSTALPGLPDPGAGPDAALLPPPAPSPVGTPQVQALALAKSVAGGGDGALAALRTAMHLSGVELIEVDGTQVDAPASPVSGLELPIGELLQIAAQNTYQHGLMASNIASTFNGIAGDKGDLSALRSNLVASVLAQSRPGSPGVTRPAAFLGSFIVDLGQQAQPATDMTTYVGNDVRLTGLQTYLILLDMASTFWIRDMAATAKSPAGSQVIAADDRTSLVDDGPCKPDDTAAKIMDGAALVGSLGGGGLAGTEFEGFMGLIGGATGVNVSKWSGADYVALINVVLSLVKLIVETFALSSAFEVVGGEPLVRTKDKNSTDQQRALKVTLNYHIGKGQYANCLRLALNTAGLDFTVPNDGPLSGAELTWHMSDSPGGVIYDPLEWYRLPGADPDDQDSDTFTNKSGESQTGIESQKRSFEVPPNAPPQMETVDIVVGIALKKSDFYNNLVDSLNTLLGGVVGGGVGFVVGLLERMDIMSVSGSVQVKDWQTDFRIRSSGKYTSAGSTYVNFTKCDAIAGDWTFGPGVSVTLDENGQGTLTYPGGWQVNVTFVDGDPPTIKLMGDGIRQEFTVIPGDFCHHEVN